ncbi:MAG TPA: hypothetical protein VFX67_07220 [Burkholderiales bacterium]|nr:hypothetical protein [Burkholderiales bacterium]
MPLPELPLDPVPVALLPVPLVLPLPVVLLPVPLVLPVPVVLAPGLVVEEVVSELVEPVAPDGPVGPAAPRLECHASYSCCDTRPSLSVSAEVGTPAAFASSLESWPSEFLSYVRNRSAEPDMALLVEPVLMLGELVLPVLLPVPLVALPLPVVLPVPVVPVTLLPVPLVEPALVPLPLVLLPLVCASAIAGASASATLRISVFLVMRSPVKVW